MQYAEYILTEQGYYVVALDGPGEIWGLDNMLTEEDDQRFYPLPVQGYPSGALLCIDAPGPKRTKTLAVFADGVTLPAGGTEIPAADVVELLVADYGWPEGTSLVDGVPVGPERAL
jgi:hypothetical protein